MILTQFGEYQKQKRMWTSLGLAVMLFSVGYFGIISHTQVITYVVTVLLVVLTSLLALTLRKDSGFAVILVIMGSGTIILGVQIPTNFPITVESLDPSAFWWEPDSEKIVILTQEREWAKYFGLFSGIFCVGLGLALAYKPSLVYVKNRLPYEYPYPVWESKGQPESKFSPILIPVKSLLDEKEKRIVSKYKFILVEIENKIYLVNLDENVPETTRVLRTKSGNSFRGV